MKQMQLTLAVLLILRLTAATALRPTLADGI